MVKGSIFVKITEEKPESGVLSILLVRPLRWSPIHTNKVNTSDLNFFIGVLPKTLGGLGDTLSKFDFDVTSGLETFGDGRD